MDEVPLKGADEGLGVSYEAEMVKPVCGCEGEAFREDVSFSLCQGMGGEVVDSELRGPGFCGV